jgi:S-adenosylhomocysteine hydrolase
MGELGDHIGHLVEVMDLANVFTKKGVGLEEFFECWFKIMGAANEVGGAVAEFVVGAGSDLLMMVSTKAGAELG